ncbi:hypothetical protein [Anaerolentibacter hominis]|uniref:hypothetical protein n=1 Tax=Anaerolentibacter hominis TaxID=3079009 RepID=UPI0031B82E19
MTDIQNKIAASQKNVEIREGIPPVPASYVLIEWIFNLSTQQNMNPEIYRNEEEASVWIMYEYSCFSCDDFLERYGISMAALSRTMQVSVNGVPDCRDSVELTAEFSGDQKSILLTKYSISGNNFDQIMNICIKVKTGDERICRGIYELLKNMDFRCSYAAVSRTLLLPDLEQLSDDYKDTYYRYLKTSGEEGQDSILDALTIDQQKQLWLLFLKDGLSAVEFEYLEGEADAGETFRLPFWELSLRLALGEAGVRINYEDNNFRITDRAGKRLYYDYSSGTPAEKMFLKILFPAIPGPRSRS